MTSEMKYKVMYAPDLAVVHAEVQGDMVADGSRDMVVKMVGMGHSHGTSLFLLDLSKATPTDSTITVYEFMSKLTTLGVKYSDKWAVIIEREQEHHQFSESVAMNRYIPVHLFSDMDSAIDWLKPVADPTN